MKMKTIAYLLLGFSVFTLVACSLDKKDNSKTSGSTSNTQQIDNQAKDKKITEKQKDASLSYNGRYYFFNVNGYILTGWQELDGFGYYKERSWYYFDPENGDMKTGWQNIKGKWYYLDPAEGYMLNGVQQVGENGECYYFHDKNGDMQTGWQQLTGAGNHEGPAWYYFNPTDGSMLTGWQNIQGKWYYFQPIDGYMLTGLHQIGDAGKSYYLNPVNGEMLTGWQQIADEWYYFATEDGSMLSNAWQGSYYLKEDGKMAHSETILINGKQYTFNEQGLVTTNP